MDLKPLTDAIAKGNRAEATKLTKAALDAKMLPQDIVEKGLVPGMSIWVKSSSATKRLCLRCSLPPGR